MSNKELIDLTEENVTTIRTIEVTSDLALRLKGDYVERAIYVTVVETGKPDERVRMSLLFDFGIMTPSNSWHPTGTAKV